MLIFALETKGSPLSKIDFVKLSNSILRANYARFHLPEMPRWNINFHGVSPIDVERWLYGDQDLILTEVSIDFPDANRPRILREAMGGLGEDVLELVRLAVSQKAIALGRDFSSRRRQIGNGIFGLGSAGNDQIVEFILRPAENFFNWLINEKVLEMIPREKYTGGISAGLAKTSYSAVNSKKYNAYLLLKTKLERLAIKDKKALIESGKTWKYRIYKLSILDYLPDCEEVLSVGSVVRKCEKWYFVDTCYSTTDNDTIEMDYVEGLEEGVIYAIVGFLASKTRLTPYGLVRLTYAS